jgi:transposase
LVVGHSHPDCRAAARVDRPGIAPEKLLRALLLQAFYSIRSERQLMEQLDCNLLFRWFVGLSMDAPVWDASTFSKNRDRLLDGDVAQKLLATVVAQPRVRALMSNEHFSVDGRLIQAWASTSRSSPGLGQMMGRRAMPDRQQAATPSGTGAGRNAATRRMPARPIPTPGWRARTDSQALWPMPGMC